MEKFFEKYEDAYQQIPQFDVSSIKQQYDIDTLKNIFSCIDLTSLNTDDSYDSIEKFCEKVKIFPNTFEDILNVAAVCAFSKYALVLKKSLIDTDIKRAVVSGGFPTSQTTIQCKIDETCDAITDGADEIDVVISVGEFLNKKYEYVNKEIYALKIKMKSAKLKVILETGMLKTPENIWKASLLAMESGADFIKTSTGKHAISATPEAVWIMAHAIKAFNEKNGKNIGIKPSGGIVTVDDAMIYWSIVKNVLGENYLNKNLFRFGASRLANNLLTEIEKLKGSGKIVNYF